MAKHYFLCNLPGGVVQTYMAENEYEADAAVNDPTRRWKRCTETAYKRQLKANQKAANAAASPAKSGGKRGK